ncbi:MAG: ABC-F family ATP-binding cassette domain-containing protein [Syntrophobacteria bacterium]
MLSFSHVSKFYGKQNVLVDCSFQVNPGERVGLIGANGTGKSTVLRLIMGLEHPDQGQVSAPGHLSPGYLPQDVLQFHGKSVLHQVMDVASDVLAIEQKLSDLTSHMDRDLPAEEIQEAAERHSRLLEEYERRNGYDLEARARKVLAGLGFREGEMHRPVEEMSGGWAMRVALARILLSEPDLILLDEPTNHLDLDSLIWLEEYLVQIPSALLLISHDRTLLDRVVHRLLELENGKITSYPGNFERYLEEKEKGQQRQWAAYRHQQEQIRQINRFIQRNRARKDRARQVQGRIKMLEKMEIIQPPSLPPRFSFQFPPPARASRIVVEFKGVSKSYGDLPVYRGLDLTIQRGERLALIGPNGAGKSTMLKLMAGVLEPDAGQVSVGSKITTGYFAQQQLEQLVPQQTVLHSLSSVAGDMPQGQLRSLLGNFLFSDDEVEKLVSVLSGGERSRLLLCRILAQQANLLLLDEPTNHLDLPGRRVLEEALKAFNGTVCLVTHDRHLINALANRILVINRGRVETFPGNYDDYEEIWKSRIQETTEKSQSEPGRKQATPSPGKTREQKRLEAQWRNELHHRKNPLARKLKELEQTIEAMTARLEELNDLLSHPNTYEDGGRVTDLNLEYHQLKRSLEQYTSQWEETALALERLEESFWQEKLPGTSRKISWQDS